MAKYLNDAGLAHLLTGLWAKVQTAIGGKLNKTFVADAGRDGLVTALLAGAASDRVNISAPLLNPATGTVNNTNGIAIMGASATVAGVMTAAQLAQLNAATADIANISLTPGPPGPQGLKGDTGNTGATGSQGATGAAGAKGVAFYGWSTASNLTNISSVSGMAVGDYVVNTGSATRTILGVSTDIGGVVLSTSATAGTAAGNIRGATGATGAAGATGSQGAKGDKGDTGATGPQGPAGTANYTAPSSGPLKDMTLTQAIAYLNNVIQGSVAVKIDHSNS